MSRFILQTIQVANSRAMGALALCALLAACGGGYQAPVSEQGRRQDVTAPEIISSSSAQRVVDLSQRAPERRIELPGASVSTSTPVTSDSVARVSPGRAIGRRVATDASNAVVSSSSSVAGATGNAAAAAGTHLVRAGDTLFSIAFQYDLDFRSLAITNGLQPPYTIFVGQELDLARSAASTASSVINSVGTPVSSNSAARSQATTGSSGGVTRQPIGGATVQPQSWAWPHQGQVLRRYTAGSNKGIDIAGNVGDPVRAASAGDVVYSGRGVQGSGNLIIIRHSDRYLSAYAHNSAMLAAEGMHVEVGDIIAEVGMNPAGDAMLHFEIRRDGQAIDPLQYLPAR
jgi:lipoprotein NlpD